MVNERLMDFSYITDIDAEDPTRGQVEEVLRELDNNNDGKLNVNEFTLLIRQVLEIMRGMMTTTTMYCNIRFCISKKKLIFTLTRPLCVCLSNCLDANS